MITGVGPVNPDNGRRPPIYVLEDAPWSAFRDVDHTHGFSTFDVDPGRPGGHTTMRVNHHAITGPFGATTVVDQFTLTRPRSGRR